MEIQTNSMSCRVCTYRWDWAKTKPQVLNEEAFKRYLTSCPRGLFKRDNVKQHLTPPIVYVKGQIRSYTA